MRQFRNRGKDARARERDISIRDRVIGVTQRGRVQRWRMWAAPLLDDSSCEPSRSDDLSIYSAFVSVDLNKKERLLRCVYTTLCVLNQRFSSRLATPPGFNLLSVYRKSARDRCPSLSSTKVEPRVSGSANED